MGSNKGRRNGNWRTPPGCLFRCGLNILIKQHNNRQFVVETFKRLFPDYQAFHAAPISDSAIWQRATTGILASKIKEHPDKNPAIARYMPAATRIVAAGQPLDREAVLAAVAEVDAVPPPALGYEPTVAVSPAAPTPAPVGFYDKATVAVSPADPIVVPLPRPAPAVSLEVLLGSNGSGRPVYWAPDRLMNFGIGISGDSGSGKTQLTRAIIADVAAAGLPVAVFDFKNDYADPDFAESAGLKVYDINSGLPFNPLALVGETVQPMRHIHEVAAILQRAWRLGDRQVADLRAALVTAYADRGISPRDRHRVADLPPAPAFDDVAARLDGGLLARLSPLFDLDLFPETEATSFADLLGSQVVLDLHALPGDRIKAALAEFLIVRLHGHLLRGAQPRRLTRLLVFDEAHRVASSQPLAELGREGRAFGVGIAVGTQFPRDIPEELAGNLHTRIFLANREPDDQRAILRALAGRSSGYEAQTLANTIARLQQFQALVKNSQIAPWAFVNVLPHFRRSTSASRLAVR